MYSLSEHFKDDIEKSQKKIKKFLKQCIICEKVPVNELKTFKVMDNKYKCGACKKNRALIIDLAKVSK